METRESLKAHPLYKELKQLQKWFKAGCYRNDVDREQWVISRIDELKNWLLWRLRFLDLSGNLYR